MESHLSSKLHLLIFASLLCLRIRAESSGSVFFLDSHNHKFLRTHSSDVVSEAGPMSLDDVAAAVTVFLGFAPPSSLSADSSSKLNEILSPNPFYRPRAVLMLEVGGIEDQRKLAHSLVNVQVGGAIRRRVIVGPSKAEIQIPDKDEVSVVSLDESLASECDAACMDKELNDLQSLLGGSYVSSALKSFDGQLSVALSSGIPLNLDMSKKADREFTVSLISLVRNIRRAMEMHGDVSGSLQRPAELVAGRFTGIEALQEQYGSEGIAQQGMELFVTTLTKLFDSLQEAYQGQIVGVIFSNGKHYSASESMLNVKFISRPSSRWLQEVPSPANSTAVVEVLLVRRTLAWITGIILLISTLLGIYFLLNMPLTRDTLLYSNVKLD